MKQRILFLCTHNSCRSQMAEGLVNHYLGDRFDACSAGTETTRVNPLAARVLAELGIDISGHRSKTIDEFAGQPFDHVITLCGSANEQCQSNACSSVPSNVGSSKAAFDKDMHRRSSTAHAPSSSDGR